MYQLYLLLKDNTEPPMEEEKTIAASHWSLDAVTTAEYIKKLEKAFTNIVDLFNLQHQKTIVRCFPCSHLQGKQPAFFTTGDNLGSGLHLRGFSLNGLWLVTNLLMWLRSPSFASFLSIPISNHHFMSLIVPLSKHMLWRWERIP